MIASAGRVCAGMYHRWDARTKSRVSTGCTYTYSGFNGDGVSFGNEWIRISCTTDTALLMKVRAFIEPLITTLFALSRTHTHTHT
jgi:hypothetical protein